MPKQRKAQTTLEYTIFVICLVSALIAMQVYIKRAIQGKFRLNADSFGEQYSPEDTTSSTTISYSSDSTTEIKTTEEDGLSRTTTQASGNESQTTSSIESVGPFGSLN